jgi:hypothetical protein
VLSVYSQVLVLIALLKRTMYGLVTHFQSFIVHILYMFFLSVQLFLVFRTCVYHILVPSVLVLEPDLEVQNE